MPKLRVSPDAPGALTVGPITGPDWQPGEERDLATLTVFDIDRMGFVPLTEERARSLAAQSGGLVELILDTTTAAKRAARED